MAKYGNYLKTLKGCPFCGNIKSRILLENSGAFLTCNKAPYHKYHLLIIPKRHVEVIKDLTWEESVDIFALSLTGIKILNGVGLNDCSILIRDGNILGKSVKHLHCHIIPNGVLEDTSINSKTRKFLNKKEEKLLKKELKEILIKNTKNLNNLTNLSKM